MCALEYQQFSSGKQVVVEADQKINRDFFAVGNEVIILGEINGDCYLAGANVQVEGKINGDLIIAGGKVDIFGEVSQDIKVFGGDINLSGTVGKNVAVAGGAIDINESAKIGGGLYAKGGTFLIAAPIIGDIELTAGKLTLSSPVSGNVEALAGSIRLTSDAKIEGNLSYWSDRDISISKDAVIQGEVLRMLQKGSVKNSTSKALAAAQVIYWLGKYISFISLLILGILFYYFLPRYMEETSSILQKTPWLAFVTGVLALLLPPVLIIILVISIVGIHISLITLTLYFLCFYIAKIFSINFIGRTLQRFLGWRLSDGVVFFIGLFAYTILVSIPVLGHVFTFLAFLFGFGSLVLAKREMSY